jgi:hypothetical protein
MREPRHAPSVGTGSPAKTATSSLLSPLKVVLSVLRGILEGALPLVILIGILALFWEVLTIVRYVTAPNGFLVTQQAELIIAEGGLVISLIVFLVAGMRTLRGVRDRHSEGDYVESTVTLMVLAISLIILAGSLWMTVGMPQHPAP